MMLTPGYSLSTKLLAIVGPTASGKSALAIELATKFGGEIICADSRTVYREMNIGTAKPTEEEMLQIPHHLLNLIAPNERFTAAKFQLMALEAIEDILKRGKLPILVGGTGLYVDSVLYDYKFPGVGKKKDARSMNHGASLDEMVLTLQKLNLEAALKIDLKNRRRVERAIETSGMSKSKNSKLRPHTLVLGMALDKKLLQQRIEKRIKKMLDKGLIDEVKVMGEKYGWSNEALRAPAYLAFKDVVLGLKSVEEGAADFARRDLNLAKRQMTWFKRNKEIVWLEAISQPVLLAEAQHLVGQFLMLGE